MSKDTLASDLTSKIKHFLEAKSSVDAEYEKKIADLKKRAEAETLPEIRAAYKKVIKGMEKERPDNLALRQAEAAKIILAVAKDLGLPLGVKGKGKKGKGGHKKSKEEMATLTGKVLSAPELKKGCAIGVLVASLGENDASIRNVLKKLQGAKKVVLSGTKRNAIWKLK